MDLAEEQTSGTHRGLPEAAATGGGVLLAVGPVTAFFTWWSWWTTVGIALTLAGVLWLVLAASVNTRRASRD
ncbi:hypothetical protein [Amycolatopsis alba]|uniref:Uncharacterized protein n=1 Tax=Amycolatopsis alba DSM 44262 TaxID=1125972 RepID=A0A229S7R2_AMYAL|nr:hypothetical protein [Amycolatopsis alba]OXM54973.1 hypothetical protein CFP75_02215 [Amycolatopsis alba DSM 44262]